MPTEGNAAEMTALPQPPKTRTNVPMNSAVNFRMNLRDSNPRSPWVNSVAQITMRTGRTRAALLSRVTTLSNPTRRSETVVCGIDDRSTVDGFLFSTEVRIAERHSPEAACRPSAAPSSL